MDTSRMSEGIELARTLLADAPAGLVVDTHDLCPELGRVLRAVAALGADLGGKVLLNAEPGVYDGRYVVTETREERSRRISFSVSREACTQLRAVAALAGAQVETSPIAGGSDVLVTIDRAGASLCATALAHAASVVATVGAASQLPVGARMAGLASSIVDALDAGRVAFRTDEQEPDEAAFSRGSMLVANIEDEYVRNFVLTARPGDVLREVVTVTCVEAS